MKWSREIERIDDRWQRWAAPDLEIILLDDGSTVYSFLNTWTAPL